MIRAALIALMASPAIAASVPKIDLNEGIELMPDGSPMIVRYMPNGRHQFRRFGHQCLENKLGGEVIPCLTQDGPVELGFLPDQRTAAAVHVANSRSHAKATWGGALFSATHGTSSSWELCSCGDDTPREHDTPAPVPLPGSLVFFAVAFLSFLPWRI